MPTSWYRDHISKSSSIKDVTIISDKLMDFSYTDSSGKTSVFKLYNPPRSSYIVTLEAVEFAIANKANLVVCDAWGEITAEAYIKGKNAGVIVLKAGVFLAKITNGEPL